jgi:ABC-2 type transport system ATP-binding protein
MIEVKNVSKSYGALKAVDGVSFDIRKGEIFGLLGPNGAGKTTTISMIAGLLKPDEGEIAFEGMDVWSNLKAVKQKMGVVPQDIALYEELSAKENLSFWGGLYGLKGPKLKEKSGFILDLLGLSEKSKAAVSTYSGGMKRRLNLGIGLLHEPKFLLLDEPTVGIDPQARINILDAVKNVARDGTTILYTTHYMEEAEELCDRLAIVDHGKILARGTVPELKRMVGEGKVVTLRGAFKPEDIRDHPMIGEGLEILKLEENLAVLSTPAEGQSMSALFADLLTGDLKIDDLTVLEPTLQSVFIKLTGRELRD